LQFERLHRLPSYNLGEIRRPSDGKIPEKIVFLACADLASRKRYSYCSKYAVMYIANMLCSISIKCMRQIYVFYMDIRAGGKQYEDL